MPAFSASAPGKTILFGEHAVVYGYPAIAVPLTNISIKIIVQPLLDNEKIHIVNVNLGENLFIEELEAENIYSYALETIMQSLKLNRLPSMQLTISSTIPVAAGLGSSAAFAVAITRAISGFLGFKLKAEELNQIAYAIEKKQHGTPSGIDNTVVCYQKPIYFKKNLPPFFLKLGKPLTLVLANSGIDSLTKEVVSDIKKKHDDDPLFIDHQFTRIGNITDEAKICLEVGNLQGIGKLMLENHRCLKKMGLSLELLDDLVNAAIEAGAYGAKLCGGGRGGNVVALVPPDKSQAVLRAMLEAGAASCMVSLIKC